jgi:Raf kinase inhibitor-like YbhB/YbcL family protein
MYIFTFLFLVLWQPPTLVIVSPDFPHDGNIPVRFTCDGEDINPTLIINGIPEGTRSLTLIVEDPDAPLTTYTQWLVWNIMPVETIPENTVPGIEGTNTVGKNLYRGPCPVSDSQRYSFKVYALSKFLQLDSDAKRYDVEKAMDGLVLAEGELIGHYSRSLAIGKQDRR